jgi:hypothetical protein
MPKRTSCSRSDRSSHLPKGAHRLPSGNYVMSSVGPPNKHGRRVRITAVHCAEPDPTQIAKVLIAWILDQAGHGD